MADITYNQSYTKMVYYELDRDIDNLLNQPNRNNVEVWVSMDDSIFNVSEILENEINKIPNWRTASYIIYNSPVDININPFKK